MARFCTNCGSSMDDTAAFCPSCGKAAVGQVSGGTPSPAAGGLTDNVASMLAYITVIPALVFLLMEPYNRNRFIRFHAFQSIFVWIAIAIIHWLFTILWFLWFIWWFLEIAVFVLLLVLILKAYQGQKWKLPVIGDIAEKQAGA
jgi:uncharacterized membrane protein